MFIVTTCYELYSLTLSALYLNSYKLMVPRFLFLDFYIASSHNIFSLHNTCSDYAIYLKELIPYIRKLIFYLI